MLDFILMITLKSISVLLMAVPESWALQLGRWGGQVYGGFRAFKGVGYTNLKAAYECRLTVSEIKTILRKHHQELGVTVAEILRLPIYRNPKLRPRYHFKDLSGLNYDQVRAQGKGLVFLTAHFGNWEYLSIPTGEGLGMKPAILARKQKMPRTNEYLNELRKIFGASISARGSAVKTILNALKNGFAVGIAGDQGGGKEGVKIRFFDRITTGPSGPFEIARRMQSPLLPIFDIRNPDGSREIRLLPALIAGSGESLDQWSIEVHLQNYYTELESIIREKPELWLWEYKRWKYCWTKTVLILKDGKSGHENQSLAIKQWIEDWQRKNPSYELRIKEINLAYRSKYHRYLLAAVFRILKPFIRGRIHWLRFFLQESGLEILFSSYADFVIGTGSSLLPLVVLLGQENRARKIISMRPSFPFVGSDFDLVILADHDKALRTGRVIRSPLMPSVIDKETQEQYGSTIQSRVKKPGPYWGILVGGSSVSFNMDDDKVLRDIQKIIQRATERKVSLLITTSRRTSAYLTKAINKALNQSQCLGLFIDASIDQQAGVVPGFLGLSEHVFVSEESVAMISESILSGCPTHLIRCRIGKERPKREAFLSSLLQQKLLIDDANYEVETIEKKTNCDRLASVRNQFLERWEAWV